MKNEVTLTWETVVAAYGIAKELRMLAVVNPSLAKVALQAATHYSTLDTILAGGKPVNSLPLALADDELRKSQQPHQTAPLRIWRRLSHVRPPSESTPRN